MKANINTLGRIVVGGVMGVTFMAGVALGHDWIVTSETVDEKVTAAKIAVLSEFCEQRAYHHWTVDQDRPAAKLAGWENERRIGLAQRFVPDLVERSELRQPVIETCNKALRPA